MSTQPIRIGIALVGDEYVVRNEDGDTDYAVIGTERAGAVRACYLDVLFESG